MYKRVAVVQFVPSYNCFAHINRVQPGLQSLNVSSPELCIEYKHTYMIYHLPIQILH